MSVEKRESRGWPIFGLSIGTFGLGLYLASRETKKRRMSNPIPFATNLETEAKIPAQVTPLNRYGLAFKALGIATGIVAVTTFCGVRVGMWYLDIQTVFTM
jgi:hypothetical protein